MRPAGLGEGLRRPARLRARTDASYAAWIVEADRRGPAREQGFGSTGEGLAAVPGEPVPACRRRVVVAEASQEMPETRQAFAAGEVSERKVGLLAKALAPGGMRLLCQPRWVRPPLSRRRS